MNKYGYISLSGDCKFEGFVFSVRGIGATLKLIPKNAAWAELGNDPMNQIGLQIIAEGPGCRGELVLGAPLAVLHEFLSDLKSMSVRANQEFSLPSMRAVSYFDPVIRCSFARHGVRHESWYMEVHLGSPSILKGKLQGQFPGEAAGYTHVTAPLDLKCLPDVISDITEFLGWLEFRMPRLVDSGRE